MEEEGLRREILVTVDGMLRFKLAVTSKRRLAYWSAVAAKTRAGVVPGSRSATGSGSAGGGPRASGLGVQGGSRSCGGRRSESNPKSHAPKVEIFLEKSSSANGGDDIHARHCDRLKRKKCSSVPSL